MSDINIMAVITDIQVLAGKMYVRVTTGSNGSTREEHLVIPEVLKDLKPGQQVHISGFVRNDTGTLVPDEYAKLCVILPEEPPKRSRVRMAKPPRETTEPALLPAKPDVQHGLAFNDYESRRAAFSSAVDVAREFAEHIRKSGQIIKIQGRDYVTVAGWSLLPAFEGANCYTVAHQIQPDGTVIAEAIVERDGQMVSRGFGACSAQERPKINDRMAMAQTRARGSALKSRYSVLVTLAGYESSLADEVEDALTIVRRQPPAKCQGEASPKSSTTVTTVAEPGQPVASTERHKVVQLSSPVTPARSEESGKSIVPTEPGKPKKSARSTEADMDDAIHKALRSSTPAKRDTGDSPGKSPGGGPVEAADKAAAPSLAAPPRKPSLEQVDFTIRMFGGNTRAVLDRAAELGVQAREVGEIDVATLKRIVEDVLKARTRERASRRESQTSTSTSVEANVLNQSQGEGKWKC